MSNLSTHLLKPEHGLEVLLKGRANLVCEGADLLFNLEKDDKKAFADMIGLFGKGKERMLQIAETHFYMCISVCIHIHIYMHSIYIYIYIYM